VLLTHCYNSCIVQLSKPVSHFENVGAVSAWHIVKFSWTFLCLQQNAFERLNTTSSHYSSFEVAESSLVRIAIPAKGEDYIDLLS
jgi:hypothetical protein